MPSMLLYVTHVSPSRRLANNGHVH